MVMWSFIKDLLRGKKTGIFERKRRIFGRKREEKGNTGMGSTYLSSRPNSSLIALENRKVTLYLQSIMCPSKGLF